MKVTPSIVNGPGDICLASHLNPVDVQPNGAPLAYTGNVIPSIYGNVARGVNAVPFLSDFNTEAGFVVITCLGRAQKPLIFSGLRSGPPLPEVPDVHPARSAGFLSLPHLEGEVAVTEIK